MLLSLQIQSALLWSMIIPTTIKARPCEFDPSPSSVWRFCDCTPIAKNAGKVFCRHVSWLNIPELPSVPGNKASTSNSSKAMAPYRMSSLSIIESGLVFIEQDSFKGQNIQLLDLSHNHIVTVNVNAFRGLENKLYQLTLNHNSLQNIPSHSLTYMMQLQYLYLKNNHISAIPLSTFHDKRLNSLRFLYLDNNLITRLHEGALSKLKLQVLTLGNNRIIQIEEGALPRSLWYLRLKNNALDSIPLGSLRNLKNLTTLDMEGNNLTQITAGSSDVSFNTEMTLLLSNNRISRIDPGGFRHFKRLKFLDLAYNQLESVPEAFLKDVMVLKKLDLSYNSFTFLHEKSFHHVFKSLKELNLEENDFHALPLALKSLLYLEKLNMNSNKLTFLSNDTIRTFKGSLKDLKLGYNSLREVPTDALEGMTKLHFLDLSKNQISELRSLAFGTYDAAGTSMVRLNLAGNQIERITDARIFLYMSSLAYLDLSYNKISEIGTEAFSRLVGLESLFLQNNRLTTFPSNALHRLEKLRYLILDDNRIMAIPADALLGMNMLTHLSIRRNDLFAVSSDSFPSHLVKNIKVIDLGQNGIIHLAPKAFYNLSALTLVNLERNNIPSINAYSFHNLKLLQKIILSHNSINATYQSAFVNLKRLATLDLSHNRLDRIEEGTFRNVPDLENLDFSHNLFVNLNLNFLTEDINLKDLDASYNELKEINIGRYRHKLIRVNLRGNRFTKIDDVFVSRYTKLESLDLSENGCTTVATTAFEGTPKLHTLNLSRNYLKYFNKGTFVQQEMYSTLDLSHNVLKQLKSDTFGLDNIYNLVLAHNKLTVIPYDALNSVRNSLSSLDLSHNQITNLESRYFNGLSNLSTLILSHNQIISIEEAAFKGLHKLRHLDLSHNPVTSWHPLVFKELGHSIELLDLANTGLFRLPRISPRGIKHLNLSYNRIHELSNEDLSPLAKLITLDISNNRLKKIETTMLDPVKDIQNLNLSHNGFSEISDEFLKSLHKLQSLRMHNLKELKDIPSESAFAFLRHLREFHLYSIPSLEQSSVNLTRVLGSLPPLRSLHIEIFRSSTLSSQLHTADSRFLRDLVITGRKLKKIDPSAFKFLRGYRVSLKIWGTRISEFSSGVLMMLNRVNYLSLDLGHNELYTFEPFLHTDPPITNLQGTILADLKLQKNPLTCDCRLKWIGDWFRFLKQDLKPKEYERRRMSWARTFCHEPTDASKTRKVLGIKFGEIGCTNSGSRAKTSIISLLAIHFVLFLFGVLDLGASGEIETSTVPN